MARDVFRIVDAWPSSYAFLADQMRRSARSVHANIAEGNGRSSRKDYARFLYDARGSLQELEADVETIHGTPLVSAQNARDLKARIRNVGRLLNALIRSLKPPSE